MIFKKKVAAFIEATYERRSMIEADYEELSIAKQCDLLELIRSSFYYKPAEESEENLAIMRWLDEQYLNTPFYGVERLLVLLIVMGYKSILKGYGV